MHANKQEQRDAIYCGDIELQWVLAIQPLATLCDINNPVILEAIEFPAPVISVSITPNQGRQ